jgi:methionine synthase II (cobalamin-independent)
LIIRNGVLPTVEAALHDQEQAGIDIVSDGELRRDNDIDYFLARILRGDDDRAATEAAGNAAAAGG